MMMLMMLCILPSFNFHTFSIVAYDPRPFVTAPPAFLHSIDLHIISYHIISSSYIRIRNQLTKRNMDDNKRIKAKVKIKLITVFCTIYELTVNDISVSQFGRVPRPFDA